MYKYIQKVFFNAYNTKRHIKPVRNKMKLCSHSFEFFVRAKN